MPFRIHFITLFTITLSLESMTLTEKNQKYISIHKQFYLNNGLNRFRTFADDINISNGRQILIMLFVRHFNPVVTFCANTNSTNEQNNMNKKEKKNFCDARPTFFTMIVISWMKTFAFFYYILIPPYNSILVRMFFINCATLLKNHCIIEIENRERNWTA